MSSNYGEDMAWLKLVVPAKVKTALHEHQIVKMTDNTYDQWACNGMELYKTGCYSGITDFHQTNGIQGWTCPYNEVKGPE